MGELHCLSQLKYNLAYYNPFQFLRLFLALGFIFESDLNYISLNLNQTEELLNPESYPKDLNEKKKKNSFKSVDEIYKYTKKLLQIVILNNKILENFNSFKIACGVIAFTREILFERNFSGNYEDGILKLINTKSLKI